MGRDWSKSAFSQLTFKRKIEIKNSKCAVKTKVCFKKNPKQLKGKMEIQFSNGSFWEL